jgi:hypothetical protein
MAKFRIKSKITIKTSGADLGQIKQLSIAVLGAKELYMQPGMVALLMPGGALLELYADYCGCPDYMFKNNNLVISYEVEDLKQAAATALSLGFNNLTGAINVCSTLQYCYLASDSGTVIGLYQQG